MNVVTSDCVRVKFDDFRTSRVLTAFSADSDGSDCDVPISNVDSATLYRVMFWLKIPDEPIAEEWDMLWRMAHAADFLDMPEMLDRACKGLAEKLKGKSPTEIQKLLA